MCLSLKDLVQLPIPVYRLVTYRGRASKVVVSALLVVFIVLTVFLGLTSFPFGFLFRLIDLAFC